MRYKILNDSNRDYTFEEREAVFEELRGLVSVQGACSDGQMLQLRIKDRKRFRYVKQFLKEHFNIDYSIAEYWNSRSDRGKYLRCDMDDIKKLCKLVLESNNDLDYFSHFDPLCKRDTVSKVVYQYGAVRYDLLTV